MAKPSKLDELKRTVTVDVAKHPGDLARHYMERFKTSRVTATNYIQKLETAGWIARSGPSTRPIFSPGYKKYTEHSYDINGLEEDIAWTQDFKPYLNLSENVSKIVSYGFTEILNNAIDHSSGKKVFVRAFQNEHQIRLAITDDGVGIFTKIAHALNLPDIRLALFELSKGKLTTDPKNHTGEGIFFTSRMFDFFAIHANGLIFHHNDGIDNDRLDELLISTKGTTIAMSIAPDSTRTITDVYKQYTTNPPDNNFSKTIVPMKLAQYGDELLISRSQAKRIIFRFDHFKTVILDFDGIEEIGQAFADELFRVYAHAHPDVEIIPKNMTEQVERMWLRAVSPR